jgi:hypothetical protein
VIQGTFSVIQGTFGTIQGTSDVTPAAVSGLRATGPPLEAISLNTQGTFGVIQGTFDTIQGIFREHSA